MKETKNLKLKTYETTTDGQELVARYIDNTSDNFQKIDEFCKTDTTLSVEGGIADAKTVGDNVSQLKEDVTKLKEKKAEIDDAAVSEDAPWSSKHIIDMLCPPLKESGNPVVCYPVAGYPLGVKSSWEPVQEGSGTPYPAGGGKNQLNPAEYEAATKTINGITFTRLNTGEVVVNGTATGTAIYVLIANFSYLISLSTNRNWSIVGENVISMQGLVSGVTVVRPSDNTSLYIRVQSGTTVKTTVQPQIEKGNTPTAWAPYENIRPINGRDSVTVERCGENLFDIAKIIETSTLTKTDRQITLKAGRAHNYDLFIATTGLDTKVPIDRLDRLPFLPKGTYKISYNTTVLGATLSIVAVAKDGSITVISTSVQATFTLSYGTLISIRCDIVEEVTFSNIQITLGSTAPTTYTPYIGQTNTLTLPETVYGGEVDAVTGESKKTWGIINNYAGETIPREWISDRDVYSADKNPTVGAQVAYRLAEPVPFTATGAQPLPALAGLNTVLTDADSATVTGRADPIKRITDLEDAVASQT